MIDVKLFADFLNEDIDDIPSLVGDQLIVPKGRVIIYGAPGQFKSYAGLQLCYGMALGTEWLGYEVHQPAKVLYLQAEIVPRQMQERGGKMNNLYGSTNNLLYGYTRDFALDTPVSWDALTKAVKENDVEYVFLDPMSQLLPGSEIDDVVMRNFLRGMDILSTITDAGVVIVHHARKSVSHGDGTTYAGAEDLRGWSGLSAWADCIVRLRRLHNLPGTIELTWEKVRYTSDQPSKWLRFDDTCGILTVSEGNPQSVVARLLDNGPMNIKEVDVVLQKEAGMTPRRCISYRQELEKSRVVEQYKDPVNKKFQMLRLVK